jgi:glycine cleavage system transcriptional repressor
MPRFSLHAIGRDQPGIVASVAGVLAEIGCNLADSRMTVLNGQFAIMLIVDSNAVDDGAVIERALADTAKQFELLISVRPIQSDAGKSDIVSSIAVSIHGSDHPGIVAQIADVIAKHTGNIVDLETRVIEQDEVATYVMLLTVGLPASTPLEGLIQALRVEAERIGVVCVVSPIDTGLL